MGPENKKIQKKLVLFSPERASFLSDGFFAIVMTLLILEIPVPELLKTEVSRLPDELLRLTPKFLSYFFSFYTLYIYWVNHHTVFQFVTKANRIMLWVNGLFLFFVALIPYVTALIGHYYFDRFAVLCYGVILLFTSVSFMYIVLYAKKQGLFHPETDQDKLKLGIRKAYMGPVVHIIALVITFINVTAGLIFYAMIPFFFFFATRVEVMEVPVD
jgi:uncharacterized membrane protein